MGGLVWSRAASTRARISWPPSKPAGFDLILADYSIPGFDGMTALTLARQDCPDVPFLFVSATIGEELAIDAMHLGATDYVLKQRLGRLVPSVQRALREAAERGGTATGGGSPPAE